MAISQAPLNLYICRQGSVNYIIWDPVKKDINNADINIIGYYVLKTSNPNETGFVNLALVSSQNPYSETDVMYIDYSSSEDALYKVCPTDGIDIGQCSTSFGVAGENDGEEIPVPLPAVWDGITDRDLWDLGFWAP
jgi:hypothetical protein